MTQRVVQVDAFTDRPFSGNPAAVVVLEKPREEGWMQNVALEMNLSETAFLVARKDGGFDLRWFTPVIEVDLCGHATLASAHVLWEDRHIEPGAKARFHTRSGVLTAERRNGAIVLDFPATPARDSEAPDGLAEALGVRPLYVGKNFDYLVEVESEAIVRALKPDFGALAAIPARGIIVTAPSSSPGFDFVSRFFAPASGVDEDAVTGSAHCTLGPFWSERLGKTSLVAYQASPRGGVVQVELEGDRVLLGGQAVTVLRGELLDVG
jgi:PhzF family phenazine biosynthesis protein